MLDVFAGNWMTIGLRGAAAVLFGLVALVTPQLTLDRLATLFAVYAALDGALALFMAARARHHDATTARLWLTDGLVSIATGLLVIAWPDLTLLALLLLVAVRALATGAVTVTAALVLWRVTSDSRIVAAIGVGSVVFGLVLIVVPAAGVVGLVWWIALFAIACGAALLTLGARLRRGGTSAVGLATAV